MNYTILMGSPRKTGNTAALLQPFLEELSVQNARCELINLYDKVLTPCTACRSCQQDWTKFGCRFEDDMQEIFDQISHAEVLVLATPIYSWYCTPPMKTVLDRLVYGMNKYYGAEKGPSLWAGKQMALVVTCGYPPAKGADLFETGMQRYCRHSKLQYAGMLCEHDLGYQHSFMEPLKEERAREFARKLNK
ncbi:MAG: flavodoxin family protein [Lachnospiraceae bacterium]